MRDYDKNDARRLDSDYIICDGNVQTTQGTMGTVIGKGSRQFPHDPHDQNNAPVLWIAPRQMLQLAPDTAWCSRCGDVRPRSYFDADISLGRHLSTLVALHSATSVFLRAAWLPGVLWWVYRVRLSTARVQKVCKSCVQELEQVEDDLAASERARHAEHERRKRRERRTTQAQA